MSFCVLSNDDKVCVIETQDLEFDFSLVPPKKKLKNRSFEYKSVSISVLYFSDSKDDCEKFLRFLQESRSIKLCADLDQLVSVDLNWSAYEKNEISQLKSSFGKLELDYKELKHQQKQMNIRLRKLEEVVNVAQIEIGFRVDGESYVFVVPAMDDNSQAEEISVLSEKMDASIQGKISITFREACRCVFGTDELKARAPTDKYEAKKLNHKVYYVKLFAIKLHNLFIKNHSVSGLYDRRMISQTALEDTVKDLTQVYHSLKSEERGDKGKKRQRIEMDAPLLDDIEDDHMQFPSED